MATLGNYIHYHAANYKQFGINKKGESGGADLGSALQANKDRLRELINTRSLSPQQCKALANYYTRLYYNQESLDKLITITDSNNQQVQVTFADLVAEVVKQYSNNSAAKSVGGAQVERILQNALSKLASTVHSKANSGGAYIQRQTFEKYFDSVNDMVKQATFAITRNQNNASFQQLTKAEKDLNERARQLLLKFQEVNANLPKMSKEVARTSHSKINLTSNAHYIDILKSAIEEYNSLIVWYQGSFGGMLAGDTHEVASALGQVIDAGVTEFATMSTNEITDYLKQNVLSGRNTNNTQTVASGLDLKMLGQVQEQLENYNTAQNFGQYHTAVDTKAGSFNIQFVSSNNSKGPQGTVDLELRPKGISALEDALGTKAIQASLKNYSNIDTMYGGTGGVSIVSGTSLQAVMSIMDTDFLNHYMNLLGVYPSMQGSSGFVAANKELYRAAGIRGLMGQLEGQHSDVLIINNKQESKVYVIPTSFLREVDDVSQQININFTPKIESYNKWNQWVSSQGSKWGQGNNSTNSWKPDQEAAQRRIINYILDLHQIKLKVSLKPSGIREFSGTYGGTSAV